MKEYYEPVLTIVEIGEHDIITASSDDNIVEPYSQE